MPIITNFTLDSGKDFGVGLWLISTKEMMWKASLGYISRVYQNLAVDFGRIKTKIQCGHAKKIVPAQVHLKQFWIFRGTLAFFAYNYMVMLFPCGGFWSCILRGREPGGAPRTEGQRMSA